MSRTLWGARAGLCAAGLFRGPQPGGELLSGARVPELAGRGAGATLCARWESRERCGTACDEEPEGADKPLSGPGCACYSEKVDYLVAAPR